MLLIWNSSTLLATIRDIAHILAMSMELVMSLIRSSVVHMQLIYAEIGW